MLMMRFGGVALALLCSACYPDRSETDGVDAPVASAAPVAAKNGTVETAPVVDPAQETAVEYVAHMKASPSGADPEAIRTIPACVACHGQDGSGIAELHTPRIGGLEAWYLARELYYFQRGIRGLQDKDVYGRYMHAFALMLNDPAEIDGLAAYFSSRTPARSAEASTGGDVEHGRALYQVCSACHGPTGEGSTELNAPRLVGQSASYLVRQIENYRHGIRGTASGDVFGKQMQPIVAATLTSSQDSADVVAYIETLEGAATESSGGAAKAEGSTSG
jgi:cytochrome c553